MTTGITDEEWLNGTIEKQAEIIDKQQEEIKSLRAQLEMLRTAIDTTLGAP